MMAGRRGGEVNERAEASDCQDCRRWTMEVTVQTELSALKKILYVDNQVKNIKFFKGSSADATPEEMARELNKFFVAPDLEPIEGK